MGRPRTQCVQGHPRTVRYTVPTWTAVVLQSGNCGGFAVCGGTVGLAVGCQRLCTRPPCRQLWMRQCLAGVRWPSAQLRLCQYPPVMAPSPRPFMGVQVVQNPRPSPYRYLAHPRGCIRDTRARVAMSKNSPGLPSNGSDSYTATGRAPMAPDSAGSDARASLTARMPQWMLPPSSTR